MFTSGRYSGGFKSIENFRNTMNLKNELCYANCERKFIITYLEGRNIKCANTVNIYITAMIIYYTVRLNLQRQFNKLHHIPFLLILPASLKPLDIPGIRLGDHL